MLWTVSVELQEAGQADLQRGCSVGNALTQTGDGSLNTMHYLTPAWPRRWLGTLTSAVHPGTWGRRSVLAVHRYRALPHLNQHTWG